MGVKLKFDNDLQYLIYQLGKDAPVVAEKAVKESGHILLESIRQEVTNNPDLSDAQKRRLLNELDEKYTVLEGSAYGYIGWLFDKWDKENPNTGMIAVWNEYGTRDRRTGNNENRGHLSPAYFTTNARRKSARKIRQMQESIVQEEWRKING